MRKTIFIACILFLCLIIFAFVGFRTLLTPESVESSAPEETVVAPAQQTGAAPLLPEWTAEHVAALSIATREKTYAFRYNDQNVVSINGQKADRGVFFTLLEQILDLPVIAVDAFPPPDTPLVTVILTVNGTPHPIRFYESDASESIAQIVFGADDALQYYTTDAWRVGAMLMTCEGTRIFDESGRETPI